MKKIFYPFLLLILFCYSLPVISQQKNSCAASLGLLGDEKDIQTKTKSGIVLVGGGGSVKPAFQWMIDRSGGGDVVVITASGTNAYNEALYSLGGVNSVETLNITSKELAENDTVARIIRNAEMLFIGGGDQSRYMRFWRGTKTADAINYLLNEKKIPVGGTSAGCAILSGLYYSGENGSVTSRQALADPYHENSTLYNNDLLKAPYLSNVLTDQHYIARQREGRHVSFLARAIKDWNIAPFGIAPDERTAVCIDENGKAIVLGENKAYFITTRHSGKPENVTAGQPLNWINKEKALKVYELGANPNGSFNVADFDSASARGGKWYWWFVDNGTLYKKEDASAKGDYVMVIHGGAGTILKKNMTAEMESAYIAALRKALQTGYDALQKGKTSIEAVELAIHTMEDNPLFNAGKGAVFTNDGRNELDASVMDGKTLAAGAIAGVSNVRNPISAAIAVMQRSEHVMMTGNGAEKFAKDAGLKIVDPKYFWTKHRWDALQQAIKEDKEKAKLDHSYRFNNERENQLSKWGIQNIDNKFGTVGAVALDKNGNLAAGTSTGGMTNKKYGRVGDAPVIGAGTYANNQTVAVSCTGWGEFYIRSVAAYDVSAMMEYKGLTVDSAAHAVIEKIGKLGGDGGMIALDKNGNMSMPFNTEGMYRGAVTKDGKIEIYIYK